MSNNREITNPPTLDDAAPDAPALDPAADNAPPPEDPGGGWQWVRSKILKLSIDRPSSTRPFGRFLYSLSNYLDGNPPVSGFSFPRCQRSKYYFEFFCQILLIKKLKQNYQQSCTQN